MSEELLKMFREMLLLLERADRRAEAEEQTRAAAQAASDEQFAADNARTEERQKRHLEQETARLESIAKNLELNERDVIASERIADALETLVNR